MAGFDWEVIQRSLPYLFKTGMTFTVTLTLLAMAGGIVFGTLLAMMRLSSHKWLSIPAGAYVNLMRSHPAGAGDPLVLLPRALHRRMGHALVRADPGGRVRLGGHHLHDVRGGVLLRDHARRHPVDPARPGLERATRWA